ESWAASGTVSRAERSSGADDRQAMDDSADRKLLCMIAAEILRYTPITSRDHAELERVGVLNFPVNQAGHSGLLRCCTDPRGRNKLAAWRSMSTGRARSSLAAGG